MKEPNAIKVSLFPASKAHFYLVQPKLSIQAYRGSGVLYTRYFSHNYGKYFSCVIFQTMLATKILSHRNNLVMITDLHRSVYLRPGGSHSHSDSGSCQSHWCTPEHTLHCWISTRWHLQDKTVQFNGSKFLLLLQTAKQVLSNLSLTSVSMV